MDSIKGQGGIQMLLTAEQEAQQIVTNAKNVKMKRLKQAKDEAERDASLYRAHLEDEYQKKVSETKDNSGSNVKWFEEETDKKIQNLKDKTSKVSGDVIAMLIKYITTVRN
ncbi:V-type proton ATPase subunit G3-like [Macadamia integrifolia]|uniref:V-type proton ATPase subunit G3-like n=1 Tax=Macadamia integrifolia TaxID=60698 RepID=UPI001C4FF12B|nr:V-type proton ATPase subunit G3-like [Macadamia integrifolia]XP_042491661.1 V-type proton ATPase subunit G3-like [Macadamia integrifolia]